MLLCTCVFLSVSVRVGSGSAIGYSCDDNGDSSSKMGQSYSMKAPREEE